MVGVRAVSAAHRDEVTVCLLSFLPFCTEAIKSAFCSDKNTKYGERRKRIRRGGLPHLFIENIF